MKSLEFTNYREAEDYLNKEYAGKVVKLEYLTAMEKKFFIGKINRLAIDVALHDPARVIVIFSNGRRFEVDKDNFFERIKKLS